MDKEKEQSIRARQIQATIKSEGFKYVVEEMAEESKDYVAMLIVETDLNKIFKLQAECEVRDKFLEKFSFYDSIKVD